MKTTTLGKCRICGDVEVSYFENYDGFMSIPVDICPTTSMLGKFYKSTVGATYNDNTGNKLAKSFERVWVEPSHLCADHVGYDMMKEHKLEPIECWREIE